MTQNAWAVVGRLVKARRERLGLRQEELRLHGGPAVATVGKIERVAQDHYPLRTQQQVEAALGWSRGTIEQVLEAVDAGDWDQLGPDWEADLIERDVPDLTGQEEAPPVRRAGELSDAELLAELTYRVRQYAEAAATTTTPTPADVITAELARRGRNPGWLMDASGLEVDELMPFLAGRRDLRPAEAAKVEKALGWAPGALGSPPTGADGGATVEQRRDRAV